MPMKSSERAEWAAHAHARAAAQDDVLQLSQAFLDYLRGHWAEVAPCSCFQLSGHTSDCAYERTVEALRQEFFAAQAGR
jgi:hypothetical protein